MALSFLLLESILVFQSLKDRCSFLLPVPVLILQKLLFLVPGKTFAIIEMHLVEQ